MERQIKKFQDIIQAAKDRIQIYDHETEWIKIRSDDKKKAHINLYETISQEKGEYILKCEAILKDCDAEKILTLNIDNNFETRKQWETSELTHIECLENINEINTRTKLIRYCIQLGSSMWNPLYDREFIGLQSWDYDKDNKSHVLVFETVDCDRFKPNPDYVSATCQTILKIIKLPKDRIIVKIYTHVTPNGWIPNWIVPLWKEKLRDRMMLYENIAKFEYEDIYTTWECEKCHAEWKVYEEKCRKCHEIKILK